jgi:hypothetical protein
MRVAVERVSRPTRHHLVPPFFANLSSLCAIWHALGKPSHDALGGAPRKSIWIRSCARPELVVVKPVHRASGFPGWTS